MQMKGQKDMSIYLGIDGGGTKTQSFLLDTRTGSVVMKRGPASNPSTAGWRGARDTVKQLIMETLAEAHADIREVRSLSAGIAGIDRERQIQLMTDEFRTFLRHNTLLEVVNDALPALTGGTRGKSGVVLIAGTGSIAVGEDEAGTIVRTGGYGHLIGDEGSGFDIGRRGIMAAIQSVENRAEKTSLWECAQNFFSIRHPCDIIERVYESEHPVGTIAAFACEVTALAPTDDVAAKILGIATDHYTAMIESIFHQLPHPVHPTVVLAGGILLHTPSVKDTLQERLPHLTFQPIDLDVAAGAALRAIRLAGEQADIDAWLAWQRETSV